MYVYNQALFFQKTDSQKSKISKKNLQNLIETLEILGFMKIQFLKKKLP